MSKAKNSGIVFLCCLLLAALTSGPAAGSSNPYGNAVSTARTEIWRAINSGKCSSATAAIMVDGRIIAFSADGDAIYDSVVDSGDVYAAEGSYIECAGFAGDIITVKARPAAAGGKNK